MDYRMLMYDMVWEILKFDVATIFSFHYILNLEVYCTCFTPKQKYN